MDESLYDRIARRAYEKFLARHGRHGSDLEDWLSAEREILDEISAETKPGEKAPRRKKPQA